jgi:Ca2+-binding RTX toxin-like protein
MRKSVLLLASIALTVLLVSGVAFAATFYGTDRADEISGTRQSDQIFGQGGNDILGGGARATT